MKYIIENKLNLNSKYLLIIINRVFKEFNKEDTMYEGKKDYYYFKNKNIIIKATVILKNKEIEIIIEKDKDE